MTDLFSICGVTRKNVRLQSADPAEYVVPIIAELVKRAIACKRSVHLSIWYPENNPKNIETFIIIWI